MELRVWQSFSCNNSSSYRLIARFSDAKAAQEAGVELDEFFHKHAVQLDAEMERNDYTWPGTLTEACTSLAKKYGFKWKENIGWGDEGYVGDEPEVAAEGDVLAIYHSYCGGGLGNEVIKVLKARGATKVDEDDGELSVSLLFSLPKDSTGVRRDVTKLFKTLQEDEDDPDGDVLEDVKPPWSRHEVAGSAAYFNDGKTIGMYLPVRPSELAAMKAWLVKHGVENPSIRLCEPGDQKKFRAISKARCLACQGALQYVDPRVHPTHTEQLECASCGGMFDLKTFMGKRKKVKATPAPPTPRAAPKAHKAKKKAKATK